MIRISGVDWSIGELLMVTAAICVVIEILLIALLGWLGGRS